jgi:cyclopropane-fatty-acyl-phospholipid synthase
MNTIDQTAARHCAKTGWLERFARRQMQKHLQRIRCGTLVIEGGGEALQFGDPHSRPDLAAKIVVHDSSAYRDFVFGGSIGGAEAYMLGKWSSPNLTDVVRLMSANIDVLNDMDDARFVGRRVVDKIMHWLNRNSEKQARENISRHYDLSNEFFSLFLDPTMMYSAAVYPQDDAGLDEAAIHKLDLICRKLELGDKDHLLEIGTGWGGLATHAAREYGCRVTTTTISRQQYEAACRRVREAGLEDRITVLCEDYRNLQGRFDKLVSVEMIEAVGHAYYGQYFRGCASLLKQDGLMLLQAITIPEQRYDYAQNSVDFIQRYIFPGGSLPSHEAILAHVRQHTDMVMVGMQEIGHDYARTLEAWRQRFLGKLDEVRALGFDETFIRMWNYYLCYCQGGFEERVIGTAQILLARPDWRPARG